MKTIVLLLVSLFILNSVGFTQNRSKKSKNSWSISDPIFEKGANGSFDETAVKDPSIVFFNNSWHLFYTARGNKEYTTSYVTAPTLNELNTAERHELKTIRGKSRYGCAPQVFYFEPQKLWYLVFQNRDSNYQPAFSTNPDISSPNKWLAHQNLLAKDTEKKWIDFWIIANKGKVYLFYTEGHNGVMVRSTKAKNFPNKWSSAKKVFDDIHEAVHVYKVKNRQEFHLIYELNNKGIRSFGLAKAKNLEGPWKKVTDMYATGKQLKWAQKQVVWSEMVSHGEAIRSGYNQYMEYEPKSSQWLIQGIRKDELGHEYQSLPWKLGIIKMAN